MQPEEGVKARRKRHLKVREQSMVQGVGRGDNGWEEKGEKGAGRTG